MEFLVVGGRQDKGAMRKSVWHRHKQGVVAKVSSLSEINPRVCLVYESPPDVCAHDQDPNIVFKAGSLVDGYVYLCTQTEVLVYEIARFRQVHYLSLPSFNDLHHVLPWGQGKVLVAVAGLDMVQELTLEGKVLREWGVLGQDPWERFSRESDYRRVVAIQPNESHPNFLFQLNADIWVTRFEQKDAACLTAKRDPIRIDVERPHDGFVHDGRIYFTTVNGHIVVIDAESRSVDRAIDLNAISRRDHALGWCRGLAVLGEDYVVVGFSRIRPTRFRENIRWIRYELGLREDKGNLPTRIVCYDLMASKELWEIDLEGCGLNSVFSIHPLVQGETACVMS